MKAEQAQSQPASAVGRSLSGLVESVYRCPRLVLTVSLIVCAVSVYAACTRLEYRTQRTDLVSPNKDYQQRWRQYLAEFGDDDDIVVVVKGVNGDRMRQALDALALQVQQQPERFDRLFYKVDLRSLHDRALLFLSTEEIGQVQANLKSMSPLLEVGPVGWGFFTLHRLVHEARDRAGKIAPDRPLSIADDQFLTQLLAISRSATQFLGKAAEYQNPWHSLLAQPSEQRDLLAEPQYFFSGDGSLAFLLARPVKEEGSFTAAQNSVQAMRGIMASVATSFPELELGLTGLPVLEDDEMTASQKDTNFASWLALLGVAVLYLVVFRGLRYPLLTVGTLLIGTAWAMGWLTLTVGHLNILSATFVVMLIGMGDYGVLWVTRYEQNRAAGADVRTALRQTAAGGGPSILTAATATAFAFYAAMLADFQAVAELGWIAGSGVLLCALACFTVLPALLTLLDRRSHESLARPAAGLRPGIDTLPYPRLAGSPLLHGAAGWLPALANRPRWVLGAGVVLTVMLGACASGVCYDHNLLHLQAQGLDSVKWEMTLIDHTAGASWHALSYTATREDALALKARYEQLPGVSRVVEIASLVPLEQERKLEQLRDMQHRLRWLPARGTVIPHALPDVHQLKTELDCLAGSLQPLADSSQQPVLIDLRRSLVALREKLGEVPTGPCAERLRGFEQRMTGDLAEDLHRLRDVSNPAAITLADLPAGLRTRYVGETGKWLLRVFAKDCLWDHEPLQQFVDRIRTVDPDATGKPFATLEGLRSLKDGFQSAGLYALAAIVLVFFADFRNFRHTLLAFAPLAMGVAISLGIMGLCGLTLNPATIIAFPLILGVGAVYGVHVVHDFLACRTAGHYTLSYLIGRAILVMALANMMSFGTLAISRHRGLAGLGLILALGVGCCMLTALVFLPAVLRLLSRRPEDETAMDSQPQRDRLAA
jgi:hopanoid biosynthesis associated RND transporter like protein HpnN